MFILNHKYLFFPNGNIHHLKSTLRKYIPVTVYNELKKILKKYCDRKNYYALNMNNEHPDITNFEISDQNIRCNNCNLLLYKGMVEKVNRLKIIHELLRKMNNAYKNTIECTYGVCSYFVRKWIHYLLIKINEQPSSIFNAVNSHELKTRKN